MYRSKQLQEETMTAKRTSTLVWMTMIVCLVVFLGIVPASLAQNLVFANTVTNEILVAPKDGSGPVSVLHSNAVSGAYGPVQLAAVPSTNKLYIGGGNYSEIREANLDGAGTTAILPNSTPGAEHFGVAVDLSGARLFYSTDNAAAGSIWVANLDGTGTASAIFIGLTGSVHGLNYDASTDRLYFAEIRDSRITQANADGSGTPTVLFDAADGVSGPRGISIDVANGWIYWAQQGGTSVNRAAIDGSGAVMTLFAAQPGFLPHSVKIDPFSQLLYWTEFTQGDLPATVMVGNSNGSGVPSVLYDVGTGMLRGLDFDEAIDAVPMLNRAALAAMRRLMRCRC
jgi:hypothetical protein